MWHQQKSFPTRKEEPMYRFSLTALMLVFPMSLMAQQTTAPAQPSAGTKVERAPGLYMTFETTMGDIHCKLFENEAPLTVKTIVGLATGKLSYIDPRTKKKVSGKPFYDGLTFHRVIPRFMIQGGDPLGNGTGEPKGPEFPFKDEFSPSLRFNIPGRLAMANSGPNTNGSQFFITEVSTPYLNDKHTIFGQCEELSVIKEIARTPAKDERPIKSIVIKHVSVERVGDKPANAPEDAFPAAKKP
jgi:peptidyl-prolyl cis-trans isomerase A (cyclophilin A)